MFDSTNDPKRWSPTRHLTILTQQDSRLGHNDSTVRKMMHSIVLLLWHIGCANVYLVSSLTMLWSLFIFGLLWRFLLELVFLWLPSFLANFFTQLDLLHTDKMTSESCHIVTLVFNSSMLQTFLWEHAKDYCANGKKPYQPRQKFTNMPKAVVARFSGLKTNLPIIYRWISSKF